MDNKLQELTDKLYNEGLSKKNSPTSSTTRDFQKENRRPRLSRPPQQKNQNR